MKYKLLLSLLAVTLFSCKKNFLERLPKNTLSPETFYNDAANLKIGLTGVYNTLQKAQLLNKIPELDAISDNAKLFKYETDLIAFSQGNAYANVEVGGTMASYYEAPYILIQRANALLDNINIPGTITQAERDDYEAEARALRAIAYMRLVYLFGDVPLYTHLIGKVEALQVTRTPRDEVAAFIISELKAARDKLGTKPFNNEKGRLTKQAVWGMLCKVLLYEARMGKRPWTEALEELTNLIPVAEGAGADLVKPGSNGQANYEALFLLSNIDNKEVLFAVKNNDLLRGTDLSKFYAVNGGNLSVSVHTNYVNDFYCTDGLPISSSPLYDAAHPYDNRDPRLKATIAVPGDMYSNNITLLPFNGRQTKGTLETDFAIKKYTTLNGITFNQGQLDVIVLRYADVLLMFAEAENEVNDDPTTAAYNAVNRVRDRVGMPGVAPDLTKQQFREEVIHERRVEFGFEGQRWFDLVTLGIAAEKINAIDELNRAFVPGKQELFPIPQSERNLNSNLSQNTNYEP